MTEFNSYPVFVADQVLMADHLNEVVNYLDEQDRLTRNKLIGIGIVCGLELQITPSQIHITKGCGVTSAGYLIVQDALTLSYYKPYELPSDFFPKYKAIYENWHMWQLLTAEQSLEEEDVESIEANKAFMRDKVVVLLLEMKERPLKNCIDTDCDDKGEKIEFAVKPLLVHRRDIDAFLKRREEPSRFNEPASSVEPVSHDLQLRRYNVPVSQLTSTDLVLNAFLELVNEPQLKRLAELLNYCYVHYKPILFEEPTNPFSNVFEVLKEKLSLIKNSNPYFIQYYYDWIDDIIKAYNEFKEKVFDVQVMCCPDDDLFPLHLMLGEATKSTSIDIKSKYRHYFLYSPLFNEQKDLLAEAQLLFRRLKLMIENYGVPNPNAFPNTLIKITPSKYIDKPLSDRCIPYYYNPIDLYQAWSWNKTRRGNAKYNLSYNANQYNNSDAIVNPLLYDIEPFNFFRVEGHIGKNYVQALSGVITQRNEYNLPFEVVALSTATVAKYVAADDKECLFRDLESLYQVIIAELVCKFGDLSCMVADVPYKANLAGGITGVAGSFDHVADAVRDEMRTIAKHTAHTRATHALKSSIASGVTSNLVASLLGVNPLALDTTNYKKGDFIRQHCAIKKGSVGELYLILVDRGQAFVRPANTDNPNINTLYAHFLYFIDCVENVMAVSWPYLLKNFTPATFNQRFAALTDEVQFIAKQTARIIEIAKELQLEDLLRRFPPLMHTCFDERLDALKKEYSERFKEVQALANFMNYFKAHPGLEHKAGVPKGGTFIIVYHENPKQRLPKDHRDLAVNMAGSTMTSVNIKENIISNTHINNLIRDASVKDPSLLKNFQVALSKYLDICKDIDDNTKDEISDILVHIPAVTAPTRFRIPEYTVIADFYLPYLCCSDCAPITYVLPKLPEAVLSIGIQPTEFCNNDEGSYKVTVSPEGGALTASAGGVEAGTFVFKPKGLKAGVNTLTYTLPDGRSTSVDVKISEPVSVDFKYEIQNDGITVKFYPGNRKIKTPKWDFGDGSSSDELEPMHTYQFEGREREFVVKLFVKEGPCFSAAEQTIRVGKPERVVFDIVPRTFCFNDERPVNFNIYPLPKNLKEIKNENKLVMTLGETLSFVPRKQKITATQEFKLSYKDTELSLKVVVPNADFIMRITNDPDPTTGIDNTTLHIKAKHDNDQYQWTLQMPERQFSFSERAVDVEYRAYEINPQQKLDIILEVSNDVPGVRCVDKKSFTITPVVLRTLMNKGDFDNNTQI